MDLLAEWVPVVLLALLAGFLIRREPRRLFPGLLLTALLFILLGRGLLALVEWSGRLDAEVGPVWVMVGFMLVALLSTVVLGIFLIWNTFEMTRKEGLRPAALSTGAAGLLLLAYVTVSLMAVALDSAELAVWLMLGGLPIGYLAFVFTAFLLYSLAYGWATKRFGKPVDAVVILGAGLIGGERVSPLLAARIDLGRRIYERSRAAGHQTLLVPSGGQGGDEKLSEAAAMGRYLEECGVEAGHLLLEDRSTDTRENLLFSAEVIERAGVLGDVAVATNNFHTFRAATMMRDARVPGYAVGAPTARYYWPSATVREFIAVLRDNLRVNGFIVGVVCVPLLWRAVAVLT